MGSKLLKEYKKLMIIPIIITAFSLFVLGNNYLNTGEFIEKGIDFKGGSQIIVTPSGQIELDLIKNVMESSLGEEVIVRKTRGLEENILIETEKEVKQKWIEDILIQEEIKYEDVSVQSIGASLSKSFWYQARLALFLAFIAMAFVVFLTFKSVVPSLAIIIAGASDIIFALAVMNLLGIGLSLASLAALLILIGYSVDTDILLSTRVLKRRGEGSIDSRIISSMKTGATMTVTGMVVFIVLYLVSSSIVLDQIAIVILAGLVADLPYTWIQNVGILKWYLERKER